MNSQSPAWFKSTYSAQSGNCVETLLSPTKALVRDSKEPKAGHLTLSESTWTALVEAFQRG